MKTLRKTLINMFFFVLMLVWSNIAGAESLESYAQKCDAAMGGVTIPDFNCDNGTLVPTTHYNPVTGYCDEPNRLKRECDPGSKFTVLTNTPSVLAVAHCRKQGFNSGYFGDIAVIQTNRNTGATCFYQALADLDDPLPAQVPAPKNGVGAIERPGREPKPFWHTPAKAARIRCVSCHDNGAIIRSPYLAQLKEGFNALPGATDFSFNKKNQLYNFIGEDFATWKVYSVEIKDNLCISCHSLGVSNLSNRLNGTAIDFSKRATAASGESHKNPYSDDSPIWMPPRIRNSDGSFKKHHTGGHDKENEAAAEAIQKCALEFDPNLLPNSEDCRIKDKSNIGITHVSLTITKVTCIDPCRNEGLEGATESAADFYAKIDINGNLTTTDEGDPDQEIITPQWKIFADIPNTQSSFPVSIQIWDKDWLTGDDLGDASPVPGKNNLDFTVDRVTGRWNGDIVWPESCAHGGNPGGEPAVEVCFKLEVGGS